MTTSDLHVVAVGARTPVGLCAESTAAAVRAGISRIGEHSSLVDGTGNPLKVACDFLIDANVIGPSRFIELAVAALAEVVSKLSLHGTLAAPLSLLLALPELRPGFKAEIAEAVVRGISSATLLQILKVAIFLAIIFFQ